MTLPAEFEKRVRGERHPVDVVWVAGDYYYAYDVQATKDKWIAELQAEFDADVQELRDAIRQVEDVDIPAAEDSKNDDLLEVWRITLQAHEAELGYKESELEEKIFEIEAL